MFIIMDIVLLFKAVDLRLAYYIFTIEIVIVFFWNRIKITYTYKKYKVFLHFLLHSARTYVYFKKFRR